MNINKKKSQQIKKRIEKEEVMCHVDMVELENIENTQEEEEMPEDNIITEFYLISSIQVILKKSECDISIKQNNETFALP